MISALLSLVTGLVGFLVSHLPLSPFQTVTLNITGFAGTGYSVDTIMGWLNWFVPIGDMLALLYVWLTAALAVIAVKIVTKPIARTATVTTAKG